MSLLLTDRQRGELNAAILEYLSSQGDKYTSTVECFRRESGQAENTSDSAISKGILEKKWTSVIRLQKRIMELESKVEQLQQQRNFGGPTDGSAANSSSGASALSTIPENSKMLPKPPANCCLTGHRAPVTVVVTHPIYSIIASGSEDATIRLWDFETKQYERTLKGHTGTITGLAFDPRGFILASCSNDMSAKLWDMNTHNCIKTLKGHDHTISAITFLPSGDQVLTCSRDTTIKVWEVSTGYCTRTLSNGHSDWVKSIAVTSDGAYLASAGVDQAVVIWQLTTNTVLQTLRGHDHVVETVCFSKKAAATASNDIPSSNGVKDSNEANDATVAISAATVLLASGSRDRSVKLWDALKGTCLLTFTAHDSWVRGLLFHPTNKYLISCSDDKTIRVLDIKEGRCMRTIADAHGHFITSIAMSNNYPILISGSVDRNICVWNCS